MQLNIKFLTTVSGSSVIIILNKKKYIFNIFEGFQRSAIEKKISVSDINHYFLTSLDNFPPIIANILSINNFINNIQNLLFDFYFDQSLLKIFNLSDKILINKANNFKDNYLEVQSIETEGISNFLIKFKDIDGSLIPNLIPKEIPLTFYKKLKLKKIIKIGDKEYNGKDFCNENIKIKSIFLIFGKKDLFKLKNLINKSEIIIFSNEIAYYHIKNILDLNQKEIFIIQNNNNVEYLDFYKFQLKNNLISNNFLLPVNTEISTYKNIIESGDELSFINDNFHLNKCEQQKIKINKNILNNNFLLFLGTGCALPSKYRNVSGIIYYNNNDLILLDTGEDTLGQIKRIYGNYNILTKLKLIYISHSHADHFLGITSILKRINHKIKIFGPKAIKDYINFFDKRHHFIELDKCKDLEKKFYSDNNIIHYNYSIRNYNSNIINLNYNDYIISFNEKNFKIDVCGCSHYKDSFSCKISHFNNIFTYSGDSEPSLLFSLLSKNSDLLIHEATYEDTEVEFARKHKHSTKFEASEIFQLSGAKNFIMTHESCRNKITDIKKNQAYDFFKYDFK